MRRGTTFSWTALSTLSVRQRTRVHTCPVGSRYSECVAARGAGVARAGCWVGRTNAGAPVLGWKGENVSTMEVAEAFGGFPGIKETNVYGVCLRLRLRVCVCVCVCVCLCLCLCLCLCVCVCVWGGGGRLPMRYCVVFAWGTAHNFPLCFDDTTRFAFIVDLQCFLKENLT